jgi:U4/U6.U5 tri-snRNP component SNU23
VNADGSNQNEPGFYCKACDRVEKDHLSFLDHLNSTRHLLQVGSSTRVARSSVDSVKQRLRDKLKSKMASAASAPPKFDYESRIQARKDAAESARQAKLQRRSDKKRSIGEPHALDGNDEDIKRQCAEPNENGVEPKKNRTAKEEEEEVVDPELKAMQEMMGFGSFGTSKK